MKGFDRSINVPNARVPSRFFIKWVMLACYLALGLLVSVGSTSAAITDSPAPQLPAWSNSSTSVNALAFDPTGVFLAGARDDGRITLWNTSTAGRVRELSSTSTAAVTGLAFSPDGTILVTSSLDSVGRLWNVSSGQFQTGLYGHGEAGAVLGAAFSPD